MQACSKESNRIETMVSKAMKEYVRKHFDNPSDFKEIAYVELKTTLDQRPPVESYLKERKINDSIYDASANMLSNMMDEFKRNIIMDEISEIEKEKVNSILIDYNAWEKAINEYKTQADYREQCLNRVLELLKDYYPIRIYEIGVRVKREDNLTLNHYYTWACDTTTSVTIYSDAVPSDDLPLKKTMLEDYTKLKDCDDIRAKSYHIGETVLEEIRSFRDKDL